MLILTRLNGKEFTLNCDLIENITENPDTTIRLVNGNLYIVKESMREVIEKTIDYKQKTVGDMLRGVTDYINSDKDKSAI